MTRKGVDDWITELAAEEPDAANLTEKVDPSQGELPPGGAFYWLAFCRLTANRSCVTDITSVPSIAGPLIFSQIRELPIPWTAFDAYARRHHLHDADFAEFESVLSEMDQEYLAVMAEQRNNQAKESD